MNKLSEAVRVLLCAGALACSRDPDERSQPGAQSSQAAPARATTMEMDHAAHVGATSADSSGRHDMAGMDHGKAPKQMAGMDHSQMLQPAMADAPATGDRGVPAAGAPMDTIATSKLKQLVNALLEDRGVRARVAEDTILLRKWAGSRSFQPQH